MLQGFKVLASSSLFPSGPYLNYLEQQGCSSEPWLSFPPNSCLCFSCFSFWPTDSSGKVASHVNANFHFQRISKQSAEIDTKMIILLVERQLFFELQKTIPDQLPYRVEKALNIRALKQERGDTVCWNWIKTCTNTEDNSLISIV